MTQGISDQAGRQKPFSNPPASNLAVTAPRIQNLVNSSPFFKVRASVEIRTSFYLDIRITGIHPDAQ